ncbi:MAG: shikimate dehydrogenase [Phycisphaerae bacterium]|nr:shikimate dehydrogenase [Phycisphaerae bacterium]
MTKLVVPIFVTAVAPTVMAMSQALTAGADMVELRCDLANVPVIREALAARRGIRLGHRHLGVILTIRSAREGGGFVGDDDTLAQLYNQTLAGPDAPELVDVELQAWQRSSAVRQVLTKATGPQSISGANLILSSHDWTGCPSDLDALLAAMHEVDAAAIFKVVWKAHSIVDGVRALGLYARHAAHDKRPFLCLAMGEFGVISRLLAAKFGAPFNFATIGVEGGSAPGQPSLTQLTNLYRWNSQRPSTRVFGVIGWPVGHSISPAIHNAGFAAIDFDGLYVPLAVEPDYDNFCSALDALRQCPGLNPGGVSVTIPHKHHAMRYVLEHGGTVEDAAGHIQAVNTILLTPDGTTSGLNTDYAGALNALTGAMAVDRRSLNGKRVAVLGAGGAARAIVAGLAAWGAQVTVFNRGLERAVTLARDFTGRTGIVDAAPMERLCERVYDIYINCTPVGMSPNTAGCPVPEDMPWNSRTVVFDTVYNPHETKMLQLAQSKGAVVVHGLEMLIQQALLQFTGFTGQPAPEVVMRQAARAALGQG